MSFATKIKAVLITGALVGAVPLLVFAENPAPTNARKALNQDLRQKQEALRQEAKTKRDALMQEAKTKREAFKAEAQKRVDALQKKVGEERAKRIDQFFNQMVRKFENAIDRLNNLADRIESRLTKTEAAGNDVSKQRDLLKAARDKISAVETALSDAKAQFAAMAKSENPKVAFEKVKELVRGVAQKVKDAHKALVDVVTAIKGLRLGSEATSTISR
ncbi:hypothetical protein A2926_02190 [Candidatus Giovannonibacteria bacterium RIFCSPLOWO2_01_FULL_44_40]|uniref:DUF5667 domain-containing protein n=1 Tax=Candidatus Giovannonibacteria bacterium RIFCSPHIGHO2_01_FULL_45_23 TaxID=1798325 RepID=A0A1F5VGI3_9BACT|nr:MAG: hypothetical protein A2834_03610 [Candidatus Giovannonibacteria bacterium RIFCSPHIGHO2_01_FULL_45_23]OGF75727.1 MAG: hypothetical protein A3C77_01625 [Candidatus Giovannonibacteria bacterium RIFCSPHIGHO2_02_FULL_45_13]OGF79964.1 MAG: hypothetical protein A2926_02190 [Candidatus Giovannonibacteria bacterium RIFCSPLOWO2_01_FULL_44_40]